MIINIRGTSGSGKSTLVYKFMDDYPVDKILNEKGKVQDYVAHTPWGQFFILGRYETQCGGCDTIKTQDEICDRIRKYVRKGHVIFEGLLVSGIATRYFELAEELFEIKYGAPFIMAFLDTPYELCIERIIERRKERGNTKELNPTNTKNKFATNEKIKGQCPQRLIRGVCRELDHTNAYPQLLSIIEEHALHETED